MLTPCANSVWVGRQDLFQFPGASTVYPMDVKMTKLHDLAVRPYQKSIIHIQLNLSECRPYRSPYPCCSINPASSRGAAMGFWHCVALPLLPSPVLESDPRRPLSPCP